MYSPGKKTKYSVRSTYSFPVVHSSEQQADRKNWKSLSNFSCVSKEKETKEGCGENQLKR